MPVHLHYIFSYWQWKQIFLHVWNNIQTTDIISRNKGLNFNSKSFISWLFHAMTMMMTNIWAIQLPMNGLSAILLLNAQTAGAIP